MNLGKNNLIIFGAQWGDEGKGKIVDLLSKAFDYVVRFNGGPNAGHTVENSRLKIVLHQLPSGILNRRCKVILSSGVVVDLDKLKSEIDQVHDLGVNTKGRILISNRCHIILSLHKHLDQFLETVKGSQAVGTTRSGIGPVYATKSSYLGVRIEDIFDSTTLREKLKILHKVYNHINWNWQQQYEHLVKLGEQFKPYVVSTEKVLLQAIKSGKTVLFEGAQGVLLDNNFGTYPYCTASLCVPGSAIVNSGIPLNNVKNILGVVKCYTTRVGQGPMPSEIQDLNLAAQIRELGHEYGATTGRPRRIGWLDIPALKYALKISGANMLVLTKVDILAKLPKFAFVRSYKLDGKKTDWFDLSTAQLSRVQTKVRWLKGIGPDLSTKEVISFGKMFSKVVEDNVEVKVVGFSFSPRTEDFYYI